MNGMAPRRPKMSGSPAAQRHALRARTNAWRGSVVESRLLSRFLAFGGTIICWTGLCLQLQILMTGPLGSVAGAWRFISFFTILMNLLAACLFTTAIIKPDLSGARASLQTASTTYMTMVGITYVLLLQSLWHPQGVQLVADLLLHYAAPIASLMFWLLCVPKSGLKWSDALRWAGIPLAYLVYALVRGATDGFYPYFFIDIGVLGLSKVLLNAGGMLIAFFVLELVFIAIGKLLGHSL